MKFNWFTRADNVPEAPTPEQAVDLELLLRAHRHNYYSGIGDSIDDLSYDQLERRVFQVLPAMPLAKEVGTHSTNPEVIALAHRLLNWTPTKL